MSRGLGDVYKRQEVDLLAKKENNLSFENLLKLAMNHLDKNSSNLAR